MATIINLTLARNIHVHWGKLQDLHPFHSEFRHALVALLRISDFKKILEDAIMSRVSVDNVDLLCYLVEEHFPELGGRLPAGQQILYVKKRIENCHRFLQKKPIDPYAYGFPLIKVNDEDSRFRFLTSVLNYVDILDKDHQTISELLDTPFRQYEQMVQFIAFFPHEKVPVLLEKMSYVEKEDFCRLTIPAIGFYKSRLSLQCLVRLEQYYSKKQSSLIPLIHRTMQKLAFNLPRIH